MRRRSRHRPANGGAKPGHTDAAADAGGGDSGGGHYLFNHKAPAKVFKVKLLDAIKAAGLTPPAALPDPRVVDCRSVGDGQNAASTAAPTLRPTWRCACGHPMRVLCRRLPPLRPPARPEGQSERVTLPDKLDQEQVHTAP